MEVKKKILFYLLWLMVIVLLALNFIENRTCNLSLAKNKIAVNKFFLKELVLPSKLPILYRFYDSCLVDNSTHLEEFKICTSIWSDCKPCTDELLEWDKQIDNLNENHNVSFLFYVYTSNYKSFLKNVFPELNIHCPIIIDTLNQFCTLNEIDPNDKLCNTFLLDENNKVLLVGNPLRSNAVKKLYLRMLKKEYD